MLLVFSLDDEEISFREQVVINGRPEQIVVKTLQHLAWFQVSEQITNFVLYIGCIAILHCRRVIFNLTL